MQENRFIELYEIYIHACCEGEYDIALEIFDKMMKELEEGHEWLRNAYLETLLRANSNENIKNKCQ